MKTESGKEKRMVQELDLLKKHQKISVKELAAALGVSEMTVRRDLELLRKNHVLERSYGYATLVEGGNGYSYEGENYDLRRARLENFAEKDRIAKYAASLIRPDDWVFLDNGTTVSRMTFYLPTDFEYTVLCYNFLYFLIPYYGGYPVIYLIGFVLALIFKCKGANPLIAAADGIRTVAVELALILAYASVVETFNLVGVNGTLSAQMEIAGINGAVIALVLGLLVLAGGLLLGTPFAYVVGALATYLVSNSNYGSYELSMMAVGAAIAMSMLLALRGSLAETVGETLGVTGVTGTEVVKRNIIFTLVLTAAIVVFLVAGSSLKFLMI